MGFGEGWVGGWVGGCGVSISRERGGEAGGWGVSTSQGRVGGEGGVSWWGTSMFRGAQGLNEAPTVQNKHGHCSAYQTEFLGVSGRPPASPRSPWVDLTLSLRILRFFTSVSCLFFPRFYVACVG